MSTKQAKATIRALKANKALLKRIGIATGPSGAQRSRAQSYASREAFARYQSALNQYRRGLGIPLDPRRDYSRYSGDYGLPRTQGARARKWDGVSVPRVRGVPLGGERDVRRWRINPNAALPILRNLSRIFDIIALAEAAAKGVIRDRYDVRIPGMRRVDGPYAPSDVYINGNGLWHAHNALHSTNPQFQISGQGFGNGVFIPFLGRQPDTIGIQIYPGRVTVAGTDWLENQMMIGYTRDNGPRWQEHSSYVREWFPRTDAQEFHYHPWVVPETFAPTVVRIPNPATNPNLERWLPPLRQPMPDPKEIYPPQDALMRAARTRVGHGTALTEALAVATLSAPDAWAFGTPARPADPSAPTRPMEPVPNAPRKPPNPRQERERKNISRGKQLGIMLFGLLDVASEWGDIVDAVYDALPRDVQKKNPCKGRGAVDQFGQYGINGADCKLAALWRNWDKLDPERAILNILENELEDKLYGAIHKRLPKQAGGPALDQAWKQFGKALEEAKGYAPWNW